MNYPLSQIADTDIPYVIGVIGSGMVSKLIQRESHSSMIPESLRWSHVLMCGRDKLGNFVFIQSHFSTDGVKKLKWSEVLETNQRAIEIIAFPYPYLLIDEALIYARLRVSYGSLDILANKNKVLESLLPDSTGVICSELLSENDGGNIQEFKNGLPDHLIQPIHFQEYMIRTKAERYQLK